MSKPYVPKSEYVSGDLTTLNEIKARLSADRKALVENSEQMDVNVSNTFSDEGIEVVSEDSGSFLESLQSYADEVVVTGKAAAAKGMEYAGEAGDFVENTTGVNLDKTSETITNMIKSRDFINAPKAIQKTFIGDVNDAFQEATGGFFGELATSDGLSLRSIKDFRNSAAERVFGMAGDYMDNLDIVDRYVQSSLLRKVLNKALDYGIKEFIKPLLENFLFPEDKEAAILDVMFTSIKVADIYTIKFLLESLEDDDARARAASKYKYTIPLILAKFRFARSEKESEYEEIREQLLYVLETLGGPNWMYNTTFMGEECYDLAFNKVSPAARTLLMDDEHVGVFIMCSGMFNDSPAVKVFTNSFPEAPILEN